MQKAGDDCDASGAGLRGDAKSPAKALRSRWPHVAKPVWTNLLATGMPWSMAPHASATRCWRLARGLARCCGCATRSGGKVTGRGRFIQPTFQMSASAGCSTGRNDEESVRSVRFGIAPGCRPCTSNSRGDACRVMPVAVIPAVLCSPAMGWTACLLPTDLSAPAARQPDWQNPDVATDYLALVLSRSPITARARPRWRNEPSTPSNATSTTSSSLCMAYGRRAGTRTPHRITRDIASRSVRCR
jgi:hypothetical protein